MKGIWLAIAGIVVFLVSVPPVVAVWDGHFLLMLEIVETMPIDRDSLQFAVLGPEPVVDAVVENPGCDGDAFQHPARNPDGDAVIRVPISGRSGFWTFGGTFSHPQHLVAEFRLPRSNNKELQRKRFLIPTGRGDRTLRITLP